MNDDVSNRTFNLAVSTTKLSARTLLKAVIKINNKWNELQAEFEEVLHTPEGFVKLPHRDLLI